MPVKGARANVGEPIDPMTRLAAVGIEAMEKHPDSRETDFGVVLVGRPVPGVSSLGVSAHGMAVFGFETPDDVVDFLLWHVEGLCAAIGRPFAVVNASGN